MSRIPPRHCDMRSREELLEELEKGANNKKLLAEVSEAFRQMMSELNMMQYQLYGQGTTAPWMRASKQRKPPSA